MGALPTIFTAGGGLNLRGFSGYLLPQQNADGSLTYHYKGTSGAAVNAEIEFGELFKAFNPKFFTQQPELQPYLFGDAGIINTNAAGKPIS